MNYKETYLYVYNQPKNKKELVLRADFDITKYNRGCDSANVSCSLREGYTNRRSVINSNTLNSNTKIVESYESYEPYGCDSYPEACFSPSHDVYNSSLPNSRAWEGIL